MQNMMNLKKRIEAVAIELDDIVSEIRNLRDNMEYDPDLLMQIESRLDVLYRLKRNMEIRWKKS